MTKTILVDSSFVIEWLLGSTKASKIPATEYQLTILSHQYAECVLFFLKKNIALNEIFLQLKNLRLHTPTRKDLTFAAVLFLKARQKKSKASMADAVLAAAAISSNLKVASFDQDFKSLGFEFVDGLWKPAKAILDS